MEILGYSHSQKHQIIYKWEIDEIIPFFESIQNIKEIVSLNSSNFTTNGDNKNIWYLQIRLLEDKEWISLFLYRINGTDRVRIGYSLFLLDNKNERKFLRITHKSFDSNDGWGYKKFLEIKQIVENKDDLIPNNILTVCVELTVYEEYKSFTTDYPLQTTQRQMTEDFKELYDSKINSDVILVVGNEKFKAHKLILSTRSPVFSTMFTHKMKENRDNEVAIPDIEPGIFNKMLEFIYTDEMNDLDVDAAYLLEAADKYQLLKLKNLCEESLSKSASIDNAIKLMILADQHNANQLLDFIFEYIMNNIKDVIKTPEYEVLEETKPLLFSQLIKKLLTSVKFNGILSSS